MVGAALVCVITTINRTVGWQFSLLALPVCYAIYRSYRMYVERIQTETYVEQMNSLHLRTIEALALAIEARDHTTHEHLERVQHYAISMGELLGLNHLELDALRAASVLHDIGKLAVPEHIINKPGKLTPQGIREDENPSGGRRGNSGARRLSLPRGADCPCPSREMGWQRISSRLEGRRNSHWRADPLSAVDCLDALASDRQYRRALNLDDAMAVVAGESGKAYDPRVVALLQKHYLRLETEAKNVARKKANQLSIDLKIERGGAPVAGFESPCKGNYVDRIAAAGQEVQFTLGLVRELGTSLNLQETLTAAARWLSGVVSFHALAAYECRGEVLLPVYVEGQDAALFSSLQIPMGEGISGWVAKHNKAIINGNPSVEPGYLNDPSLFTTLRSALAVPLEGMNGVVGALTLYHNSQDAFGHDELRILTGISAKIGHSIENILK